MVAWAGVIQDIVDFTCLRLANIMCLMRYYCGLGRRNTIFIHHCIIVPFNAEMVFSLFLKLSDKFVTFQTTQNVQYGPENLIHLMCSSLSQHR